MICALRRNARNSSASSAEQVAAFETDAAGVRLDQPQHQPAHGGLAAAGLADQRQRLAGLDAKTDAIDRLHKRASASRTPNDRRRNALPGLRPRAARSWYQLVSRALRQREAMRCSNRDPEFSGAPLRLRLCCTAPGERSRIALSSRHQPLQRRLDAARPVARAYRDHRRWRLDARLADERAARGEAAARAAARSCWAPCPRWWRGARPGDRAAGSSRAGRRCRDAAGLRTMHRPAARSTISPAYITATSSQTSATTPRSWVIRMIAAPLAAFNSRIRSRICACSVTSSAVVGSSAISSIGSQASAIAIMTRWRMPPDSLCGYSSTRRSGEGIWTRRSSSIARSRAARRDAAAMAQDGFDDLLADGKTRIERRHRLLEDHRQPVAAQVAQGFVRHIEQIKAVEADRAGDFGGILRQQPHDRERGDALAAAGFADQAERRAIRHAEVDAVDGMGGAAVVAMEDDAQVLDFDQRDCRSFLCPRSRLRCRRR